MNADDRRERLRSLTAEAASEWSRRDFEAEADATGRKPPTPGGLYVLPTTSHLPIEWAVLASRAGGAWLAVPADTTPLVGSADVWIPAGEPVGPLCLRCRFGIELPHGAFEGGHRTGAVPEAARRRALETWESHRQGELEPSPLAQETEADPEYRNWEDDVLRPAVGAVREAVSTAPHRPARPRAVRFLAPLAAALTALAIGLGIWGWQLRQEVRRLSEPVVIGRTHEVPVGSETRGTVTLRTDPAAERLLVFVILSPEQAVHEAYRLELVEASGAPDPTAPEDRVTWSSPPVELGPVPELNLVLPRRLAEDPRGLRLRVVGIDGEAERVLADVPVRLEPAAPDDPRTERLDR